MTETLYGMLDQVEDSLLSPVRQDKFKSSALATFADLFCGIGGFHVAGSQEGLTGVFACDIDADARHWYERNFDLRPAGDIGKVDIDSVPDHDVLFAGLPCQPFSIIGNRNGLADERGSLFEDTARMIEIKRPRAVVIENVRQFTTNRGGEAIRWVVGALIEMGYHVDWKVLNALDFGLPQRRERVFVVATDKDFGMRFPWPEKGVSAKPLADVLEPNPGREYYVSKHIREKRARQHRAEFSPAVWHENKGGNVSSHPYSCALRAGASYNYLLVDGKRRFTPRELFRLQGFPDSFDIPSNVSLARRLTGNSVAVPVVRAVIRSLERVYA